MKRCQAHWLFAVGLFLILTPAPAAQAQTFEEAYQSYTRNLFPSAELQFRAAIKKAKNKEERASFLKFIGICQYMRGDRKSAATTFYEALGSDRNVLIEEDEVLDPAVLTFFGIVKTHWLNSPEGRAASSPQPAPFSATVPAPAPMPMPAPTAQAQPMTVTQPGRDKNPVQEVAPVTRPVTPEPRSTPAMTKKPKKDKAESGTRQISWMHFMPFGVGQFHNDSYLWGSAFAAGQVAVLYRYMTVKGRIADEIAQNRQVADNPSLQQEVKDDFLAKNNKHIKDLKSDRDTAGTAFVLLYAAGVAQAIIFAPRRPPESTSGTEASAATPGKSFTTAWLPGTPGGSFVLQLRLNLE